MIKRIFTSAPLTFMCISGLTMFTLGTATVNTSIQSLEAATAKQCMTNDWPADKHQIHIDWCLDNGYKVTSSSL